MDGLGRQEQRVKRKLERHPEALGTKDVNALGELLRRGDVETRLFVLDTLVTDVENQPNDIHRVRESVFELFDDPELSVRLKAFELGGRLAHEYRHWDETSLAEAWVAARQESQWETSYFDKVLSSFVFS